MKIPRKVICGDTIWDVKFKKTLVEGGIECDGLCCPEDRIIYIRMGLSPKLRWQVFSHESIHAMDFSTNGKFRLKEETVSWLELALADWLHQNFIGPPR